MNKTEISTNEGHHKVYRNSSPVVEIPQAHILGGADPKLHGLVLKRPNEDMPYASVRHPFFRTIKNDPTTHEEDIVLLHAQKLDRAVVPKSCALTVGSEMETFTLHEDVRRNGHEKIRPTWTGRGLNTRLNALGQHTSPEVWDYMLELNGVASSSTYQRAQDLLWMGAAMHQSVEADGGSVKYLPVSSQPFVSHPDDVNPHPYVRRMVLDYLTFEKTQDLGTSYQIHIQMLDINSGIYTINALRRIPHLLMAMALNGPFVQHQDSGLLSAREAARKRLGTGGNMRELPEWEQLLRESVEKMKNEPTPSLIRAISQHEDFRLRADISSLDPQTAGGTIEFMFLDNPGGNFSKMLMFQELFRLITWRLYSAYAAGEPLPQVLFGPAAGALITENKSAVTSAGGKAMIFNGLGNPTTVQSQKDHLLRWIGDDPKFEDNPVYPFKDLGGEVDRSLRVPAFNGLDSRSMASFYDSGIGTPGHYQRALFDHSLQNSGISEAQAINIALIDYADSYQDYLNRSATQNLT